MDEAKEEATNASCGRRSSRIQKNREATEKRRREREEAEKLLDEQIAEGKRNKRGGGQKSQKCVEGREEEIELSGESADDDDIRVEKIVLSPARKKTKKSSAPAHLGCNSIAKLANSTCFHFNCLFQNLYSVMLKIMIFI